MKNCKKQYMLHVLPHLPPYGSAPSPPPRPAEPPPAPVRANHIIAVEHSARVRCRSARRLPTARRRVHLHRIVKPHRPIDQHRLVAHVPRRSRRRRGVSLLRGEEVVGRELVDGLSVHGEDPAVGLGGRVSTYGEGGERGDVLSTRETFPRPGPRLPCW